MNLKSSAELKAAAKNQMFGKYRPAIGAYVLMNLSLLVIDLAFTLSLPDNTVGTVIGYIVDVLILLLTGIFEAGNCFLYLCIICDRPVNSTMVFNGFKSNADKAILLQLCLLGMDFIAAVPLVVFSVAFEMTEAPVWYLFIGLGTVIFIAGYAWVSIMFFPAFYLMNDHPAYDVKTILRESYRLMQGNFCKTLYLFVSFIPMQLLAVLSLGVGALWVAPYRYSTYAEYFLDLMRNKKA